MSDLDTTERVGLYRTYRSSACAINSALVQSLDKPTVERGAEALGILRSGVLVFGTEDETSVLMDYCIYNLRKDGLNAVEEFPVEGADPFRSGESALGDGQREREQPFGAEPEIDVREPEKAVDGQAGAGQQGQGECELAGHERAAQVIAPAAQGPASVLQRLDRVRPDGLPGGRAAEQNPAERGCGKREE